MTTTKSRKPKSNAPTRPVDGGGPAPWIRHLVLAFVSAVLVAALWATRSNWVAEMRLWKAVGDASYLLVLAAVTLGPLSKLFQRTRSWLRWRRQIGIWFAITATLHATLILNGWARWSLRRFLGYEFVPQLGREARLEPGFGLANLVGATALFLALVLAATSSDWAIRRLGRPAWTWLHRLAETVLVLSLLHGGYFLFVHFTDSFHKAPAPDPDWFAVPFVLSGMGAIALKSVAFLRSADGSRSAG